jgi:cytochrome aa3-600 menaquinol oxidase subunit 1
VSIKDSIRLPWSPAIKLQQLTGKYFSQTTLGTSILFTAAGLVWLAVMGLAALFFRLILLNPYNTEAIAPIYYSLLTLHGYVAMYILVPFLTIGIGMYAMYKEEGMELTHFNLVNVLFWLANLGMVIALAGGPMTSWYITPPLGLLQTTFNFYSGPAIALTYIGLFITEACITAVAGITVFDGIRTRRNKGKLSIFPTYALTFTAMIVFTTPFLMATLMWYTLGILAHVYVNPTVAFLLFWMWGHPVVYFVPFAVFGALYAYIPKFAGRKLFSEKWARWNLFLLFVFTMLVWAHHMLVWPLPVWIRGFVNASTLLLAAGSGVTVLNLGLTIFLAKRYDFSDIRGLAYFLALLGFIIAGIPALILPENALNPIVHNTYYVVGHFHLMIWTIIILGSMGIIIDQFLNAFGRIAPLSNLSLKSIRAGLLLWFGSFLVVGFAMMAAGYQGLIRREIAYPVEFLPYMQTMTIFTWLGGIGFVLMAVPAFSMVTRWLVMKYYSGVVEQ